MTRAFDLNLGEIMFMPKILRRIRQLAPGASVRSVAASAAQIERGLESGEIDLAVGYFPDLREKSFMERHLFFHHFVCLLRANHPITATTLSIAQFLSYEHAVVYGAGRTYESDVIASTASRPRAIGPRRSATAPRPSTP